MLVMAFHLIRLMLFGILSDLSDHRSESCAPLDTEELGEFHLFDKGEISSDDIMWSLARKDI